MNKPFLSNTNYVISPGIIFPVEYVLGLIVYPSYAADYHIYLNEINVQHAVHLSDYVITLRFKTLSENFTLDCTFSKDSIKTDNDYRLDFIDNRTKQPCGCMIVTEDFIQWLQHTPNILFSRHTDAVMINPTYICYTTHVTNNTLYVNNTKVDEVHFTNAVILDEATADDYNQKPGTLYIPEEIQPTSTVGNVQGMHSLVLRNSTQSVTLTGKSVGFSIQYPKLENMEDSSDTQDKFCRVHIETEDGLITFKDCSR